MFGIVFGIYIYRKDFNISLTELRFKLDKEIRGGKIMRQIKLITLLIALLSFVGSAFSQDDFYPSSKKKSNNKEGVTNGSGDESVSEDDYSTASDYYIDNRENEREQAYNDRMGITDSTTYYEDENGNLRITNNYYSGDNYDFENEYYDYEYSSRIKRFRRNTGNYGYYDDYYTNYYWYDYDPYYYGTSIYSSFNWWNPRNTRWNAGWSYYGGWSLGWSWGWGYSGNFGYCGTGNYGYNGWYGSSYWGGHHHHHDYYASNNYYNSYDHNSHYYGKRKRGSSSSSYGARSGGSPLAVKSKTAGKTFGEKYESAIRNNPGKYGTNTKSGTRPLKNFGDVRTGRSDDYGKSTPRTNPYTKSGTNNNAYTKPRTTTKSNTGYSRPNTSYTRPRGSSTRPSGGNKPSYTKPSYSKPKTYSKPKSYNRPKPTARPSYSKPSGKSYNRGGSSTKSRTSSPSRSSGTKSRSSSSRSSGGKRR